MGAPVSEPLASGTIVVASARHGPPMQALAKETASILRALRAEARTDTVAPPGADFVVLLVEEGVDLRSVALPDLTNRAATALGFAQEEGVDGNARATVNAARKHLRAHHATLGSRELVFHTGHFGVMGLESDAQRERLEVLLQALVLDAERLRLKREGWEEPDA